MAEALETSMQTTWICFYGPASSRLTALSCTPAIQAFTFRDHAHACLARRWAKSGQDTRPCEFSEFSSDRLIQAEEEGDDAVCRHWIDLAS